MADGTLPLPDEFTTGLDGGAVVFQIADHRYALPVASVEAITPPPRLCLVPHAPPGLLGAGNLGGQVVPVLDLGGLLPGCRSPRQYDDGGEVIRVRAAGGSLGLWVDRVERLTMGEGEAAAAIPIDLAPIVAGALRAPSLSPVAHAPLGDANDIVMQPAAPPAQDSFILIEAAGERAQLPRETVLELIEPPPIAVIPGAPVGFCGVGMLRGEALPILSLAALLGVPEGDGFAAFALAALPDGNRLLLGFDRIIGLRVRRRRTGRRWVDRVSEGSNEDGRPVDLAAVVPDVLRRIVADFAALPAIAGDDKTQADDAAAPYLAFAAAGQLCALPAGAVDRVVAAQPAIALPRRRAGASDGIDHAIELRGQIVPVVTLHERLGLAQDAVAAPSAYVVLRTAAGPIAIAAERVSRLVSLRPDQISPPPGEQEAIDGVARLEDDADLLRLVAPDRVAVLG